MLWELMKQLGVSADKTLMIGDTASDMLLAQNAGVDAVAALYGLQPEQHLALFQPIDYLPQIQALPKWLNQSL